MNMITWFFTINNTNSDVSEPFQAGRESHHIRLGRLARATVEPIQVDDNPELSRLQHLLIELGLGSNSHQVLCLTHQPAPFASYALQPSRHFQRLQRPVQEKKL